MLAYFFRIGLYGVLLFLLTLPTFAQRNQLYEGRYENEIGEQGQARFYYYQPRRSDEKILNGDFYFAVTYTDSVQQNVLVKKVYDGAYQKDQKHGDWNYDFKEYKVLLQDIENLNLQYDINGTYTNIQGAYNEGVPIGEWIYREDSMQDSQYLRTVRRGVANFSNGQLTGAFIFSNKSETGFEVQGYFNEAGRMHQQWEIRYPSDSSIIEEVRSYQNGFLTSIVRINQITGQVMDSLVYNDVQERLQMLNSDTKSREFSVGEQGFGLLFDHGYPNNSVKNTRQQPGNSVVQQALNNFVSVDLKIDEVQGRKPIQLAATSRFKYDVSEEEKKAIQQLNTQVDSLRAQVAPLAGNEAFELNRQRSDSLALVFSYFREIDRQLTVLDSVAAFMQTPEYQFVNPRILYGDSLSFAQKTDTIEYVVDGEPKQHIIQLPGEPYDSASLPIRLKQYVSNITDFTKPKIALVIDELKSIEIEGVNRALEEKISQKHKQVDSLYARVGQATSSKDAPRSIADIVYQTFVDGQVNQLERQYSQVNNFMAKQQIGDSIYAVLDTLETLHTYLDTIPKYVKLVDNTYTEKTFDPYTFSYDFTRRVKKDLYKKAAESLYQHLLVELAQERNYHQLVPRAKEIVTLLDRLMELSDKNTRALERRLRRTRSPQEIKELIGLA